MLCVLSGVFRVLIGFVVACFVAALVQVLFARSGAPSGGNEADLPELVAMTTTHFAVFASPFALVAMVLGEWQSLRGWLYYAVAGLGVAVAGFLAQYASEIAGPTIFNPYAMQAFLAPGLAGGIAYWLVSGRSAGCRRPIDG